MVNLTIHKQNVQYQYIADTINFGHVQTHDDFSKELKHLQSELDKAIEAKAITGEHAKDAETHMKKALLQAGESSPDKKTLIDHLTQVKELVTSIEGLVTVFASAITAVGALF